MKSDRRMGRNFLLASHRDDANATLAAVGYSLRCLLAWLAWHWRVLIMAWFAADQGDFAFLSDKI